LEDDGVGFGHARRRSRIKGDGHALARNTDDVVAFEAPSVEHHGHERTLLHGAITKEPAAAGGLLSMHGPGDYLTKPFVLSHSVATAATSFLSTAIDLLRLV